MKVFSESIISEMKPESNSEVRPGTLCTVVGPCMQFGVVNRNNRIYSKKLVEDKILNNSTVKEALKNRSMLGEGGHPENRIDISYPDVGLAVEKLWIPEGDGNMLWGKFAILDTPVGKILNTLVRYGTKLGISARAVADSIQRDGHEVILENSYELITFDAVPEPGFKCARLEQVDSVSKPIDKMSTKELKESSSALKSFQNPVFESRIRILDKEISKREKKADLHAVLESVNRLADAVDKSANKLHSIKYENTLISLIKEAKDIVDEVKKSNISSNKSISNKCSDNIYIKKFNTDNTLNEKFNISNLLNNNDDTALKKMCLQFRRNSHE